MVIKKHYLFLTESPSSFCFKRCLFTNLHLSIFKWEILKHCSPYRGGKRKCDLCLTEKLLILKNKDNPLNRRSELMGKCRHLRKFKLECVKQFNRFFYCQCFYFQYHTCHDIYSNVLNLCIILLTFFSLFFTLMSSFLYGRNETVVGVK